MGQSLAQKIDTAPAHPTINSGTALTDTDYLSTFYLPNLPTLPV